MTTYPASQRQFLFVGPLGSGTSTYAHQLAEQLAKDRGAAHIDALPRDVTPNAIAARARALADQLKAIDPQRAVVLAINPDILAVLWPLLNSTRTTLIVSASSEAAAAELRLDMRYAERFLLGTPTPGLVEGSVILHHSPTTPSEGIAAALCRTAFGNEE